MSSSNDGYLPLRPAVSIIFTFNNEVFVIKRQNYLKAFPGFHAFPGGKVDREDYKGKITTRFLSDYEGHLMHGLIREVKEELDVDLVQLIEDGQVEDFWEFGQAITPPFHTHRFETHFYQCKLSQKMELVADKDEAQFSGWKDADALYEEYLQGKVLAVPPTVIIAKRLADTIERGEFFNFNLLYDPDTEVPMIETIHGVKQFLPLSNTFPPAYRTNCFLIGDKDSKKILVDPSPKDEKEYSKLKKSVSQYEVNEIFLTHHHPDHHEFAPQLANELGVPLGMSQLTHRLILEKWGKDYFEGLSINFYKKSFVVTKWKEKEVKVYEVPGHASGQLALAPDCMSWFLAGDLIQSVGTVVIGGKNADMKDYFNSLEMVIKKNPNFVIPSHGIPMGGVFQIKATLKHRKRREETIRNLLNEGKNVEEMFEIIYEGLKPSLKKYAIATIESHLKKIKEEN